MSDGDPALTALRDRAAQVAVAELTWLFGRLPHLDEHSRGQIGQALQAVLDALLPAGAAGVDGRLLRELFDL